MHIYTTINYSLFRASNPPKKENIYIAETRIKKK